MPTVTESDKIGDAAYQLGDIYEGRSYKQYRRAAHYYERASVAHRAQRCRITIG